LEFQPIKVLEAPLWGFLYLFTIKGKKMKLLRRDVQDIYIQIDSIGGLDKPIEARVFKNNQEVHNEPLVFKTNSSFIKALKKLDGFEFENALNGIIGFRKIADENNYYHIQLLVFEGVEYATSIELN
jgi:hypothetical protein